MGEDVPRRMRRFYRGNEQQKPTEQEVKEKLAGLAVKEVDSFREKHSRYPERQEAEEISETIFKQLKQEFEKEKSRQEESAKIKKTLEEAMGKSSGPKEIEQESGMGFLESRRLRRMQGQKELQAKQQTRGKKELVKSPAKAENGNGKRVKKNLKLDEEEAESSEEISMKGLLGEDEKISEFEELGGEAGEDEEIKSLAGIEELSSMDEGMEGEEGKEFDLLEKEIGAKAPSCPNCQNKAEELVYCPKCGLAFCNHCAKGIEVQELAIKYTCPKCGTEFKKRKGAETL